MTRPLKKSVLAAAISLGALLAAAPAQAAIVTGSWDPPMVSPPFDGLGWTATINFDVPDDCLDATGDIFNVRFINRSFGCGSATPAIKVLRAQIGIYDLDTEVLQYVVTLNAASLRPNVLRIEDGGDITYLYSLLPSDPAELEVGGTDYFFRLALPGGAPQLQYSTSSNFFSFADASDDPPTETLFRTDPNGSRDAVLLATELKVGDRLFTVPEPASAALVLLALGAGFAARRRGAAA